MTSSGGNFPEFDEPFLRKLELDRAYEMRKREEHRAKEMVRKRYRDLTKEDLDFIKREMDRSFGPFGEDAHKVEPGQVSQLVAKLEKAVEDMQKEVADISKENAELRKENEKLREAISIVQSKR